MSKTKMPLKSEADYYSDESLEGEIKRLRKEHTALSRDVETQLRKMRSGQVVIHRSALGRFLERLKTGGFFHAP